jgi:hypothetical protein
MDSCEISTVCGVDGSIVCIESDHESVHIYHLQLADVQTSLIL